MAPRNPSDWDDLWDSGLAFEKRMKGFEKRMGLHRKRIETRHDDIRRRVSEASNRVKVKRTLNVRHLRDDVWYTKESTELDKIRKGYYKRKL